MSPRRSSITVLVPAVLVACATWCGAAHAATAQVVPGAGEDDWPEVRYVASPGEVNDVTHTVEEWEGETPTTVHVADAAAEIVPGPGCVAVDAHAVRCTIRYGVIVALLLGDGNDRFT
jgi:hypothetical protein